MLEIIFSMIKDFPHEISLGRMFESLVLLGLIWSKLKPHLTKIEDRLLGVENAVQNGFKDGEIRFQKLESDHKVLRADLEKLQKTKGVEYAKGL